MKTNDQILVILNPNHGYLFVTSWFYEAFEYSSCIKK